MHLKQIFALFALGLAVARAVPTSKIDGILEEEILKLTEEAEDQERSKKSVLLFNQPTAVAPGQTLIQVPGQPAQLLNIQSVPQTVETLNIQSNGQPAQLFNIQSVPQTVETLNIQSNGQLAQLLNIQSVPQTVETLNIQQPVQTLSIQANGQPAQFLNIQSVPQTVETLSIQSNGQPAQLLNIQSSPQTMETLSIQQPVQTLSIQSNGQPALNIAPQTFETLSIQSNGQPAQLLNIQSGPQTVETFSIQSNGQPAQLLNIQSVNPQTVETLSIQQPLQTLSIQANGQPAQLFNIQSRPQTVETLNIQPGGQIQTLSFVDGQPSATVITQPGSSITEIIQPAQVLPAQTNVNIVQPSVSVKESVPGGAIVETITQEIVNPITEQVVVPGYREQVVVSPSKPFFVMDQETLSSYVNVPQVQLYNPRVLAAVRPNSVVVEEPLRVLKESVVDTVPMLGGRVLESVISRVV